MAQLDPDSMTEAFLEISDSMITTYRTDQLSKSISGQWDLLRKKLEKEGVSRRKHQETLERCADILTDYLRKESEEIIQSRAYAILFPMFLLYSVDEVDAFVSSLEGLSSRV